MTETRPSYEQLEAQLAQALDLVRALRSGEVDAIISDRDIALVRLRATEEALRRLTEELEGRVRDRTARLEEANRALEQSNRQLEETLAALRTTHIKLLEAERASAIATLGAALAHEINGPLMGVLGAVDYLRSRPAAPGSERVLADIDDGLHSIAAIARNLLHLGRPPARLQYRTDVATAIHRAVSLLQADLRARGIEVRVELPDHLPKVAGDETRLQQVFTNLIANARDALEASAVKEVWVRACNEPGVVRIEVEDSGPGIPAESVSRLFEPFFTTKPGAGTGMGLAVSRALVEDSGGVLKLESEPGHGARFVIRLPTAGRAGPRNG